jgi:hypothetical protein
VIQEGGNVHTYRCTVACLSAYLWFAKRMAGPVADGIQVWGQIYKYRVQYSFCNSAGE